MKEQELLIYGRNPVKEALKTNRVKSIFLMDGFSFKEILDLVDKKQVRVTYLSNKEMNNMCDGVHQGVAATVKNYEYYSLESLIHVAKQQEHPVIVILDGINDPHNFGAIMRSCDVFNATGIIISKHHQVPLNATVAKTSVGAINYVPVAIVSNINQAMDELKKEGFWIVSTDGSATTKYQDLKYDFNVALVIGSEGEGVSKLIIKNSDYVVKIPEHGHINSLNASVAAGILLAKIKEND